MIQRIFGFHRDDQLMSYVMHGVRWGAGAGSEHFFVRAKTRMQQLATQVKFCKVLTVPT